MQILNLLSAMNEDSKYVKDIRSRSKVRFLLGLMARIKRFLYFKYAVWVARKNGAKIGNYVTLPLALARRAGSNLTVGNHTSIQSDKIDLRQPVTIGNNVIIGGGVEVITLSHNIDSPDWEHKGYGGTVIEDYVWLATSVMVLPSCTKIGYGAVVAAGSVVAKNVDTMDIIAGSPPVVLRKRKEVHYNLCIEGLLGNDLLTYWKTRKNINVD